MLISMGFAVILVSFHLLCVKKSFKNIILVVESHSNTRRTLNDRLPCLGVRSFKTEPGSQYLVQMDVTQKF